MKRLLFLLVLLPFSSLVFSGETRPLKAVRIQMKDAADPWEIEANRVSKAAPTLTLRKVATATWSELSAAGAKRCNSHRTQVTPQPEDLCINQGPYPCGGDHCNPGPTQGTCCWLCTGMPNDYCADLSCPGPGGGCEGCHGRVCCRGVTVQAAHVALGAFLSDLSQRTGMSFTALRMDPNSMVTIDVPEAPFDDWTNAIAKQLHAVPVFRSGSGSTDFISREDLGRLSFPSGASSSFDLNLDGYDPGSGIREIAMRGKIDIVVKAGLGDWMLTGNLLGVTWKEALDTLLKEIHYPGHAVMRANGLVEIVE